MSGNQNEIELVLARPAPRVPGLVHLWWKAPTLTDGLAVQVYVNGELHDAIAHPQQRETWLWLDPSRVHRIELLATSVDAAWQPQLQTWQVNDIASITLVRDETLPVDTQLTVNVDGAEHDRGAMWPSDVSRGGFGALFGEGGFGFDAITGPGLGEGQLGMGPLGTDGAAWRWRRDDLTAGEHDLRINALDDAGQSVTDPLVLDDRTIERLPAPAVAVAVDENFNLSWSQ